MCILFSITVGLCVW